MSMPGFPTDSPASVSPLTMRMLLAYLQGYVDSGRWTRTPLCSSRLSRTTPTRIRS